MRDSGGPAFPMKGMTDRNGQKLEWVYSEGMTLRDYFAAKAMQGIIAGVFSNGAIARPGDSEKVSKSAYALADAMLEARK